MAGSGMILCHCSGLISEDNFYSVPDIFQDMLGSSVIHLQPGSMRKQLNKEKYSQQFIFEIKSDKNFTAGERIFFLEGPTQCIDRKESNINYNQFEGESSLISTIHNYRCRKMSLFTFRNSADEVIRELKGFFMIKGQNPKNLVKFNRGEAALSP